MQQPKVESRQAVLRPARRDRLEKMEKMQRPREKGLELLLF
jgi:hypothetical protein